MAIKFLQRIDAFLRGLSGPLAEKLHLPHLKEHFPTLVYSALFFTLLHLVVAPVLSKKFAPAAYGKLKGRKARNNWNIHIVSFVNAVALVWLSFRCMNQPSLSEDKAFGWHESVGTANAVAVGYFFWDTIDAIVNFTDLGFVLHGVSCTTLYLLTFWPYMGYYSPRYLIWELSTPFLNIHWFLDKLDMTGSTVQYVNGVFLLSSFFFVRIVYGWYTNIPFLMTLWETKDQIPIVFPVLLVLGNGMLNVLNIIWFSKMIKALRKRFEAEAKPLLQRTIQDGPVVQEQ